jgi:hypothetical protein
MKFGNEFWLILFQEYISPNLVAVYATRRKLRYEANQVWMNTTFISQGPQSSGI